MKKNLIIIPVIFVAIATLITGNSYFIEPKVALQTTPSRMLIPLYTDYPNSWQDVISANGSKNIDAIVNVSDGSGSSKLSNYTTGISALQTNGIKVYGYVFTGYSSRSLTIVEGEIDNWQLWYNVDGIMLDEVSNTSSGLSYYTTLYNYIHNKGMRIILNAGTDTIEQYMSISDTVCIYENDSGSIPFPTWASNYPASKFCALKYGQDISGMMNFVSESQSKNIGNVFVTSDTLPNPWDSLPSYLPEEANLLAGTSSPTPTSTFVAPSGWTCHSDDKLNLCYQLK